jgi:diadenosine tetraphosphate (Ap4A) HIT family hydrolase
LGKKHMPEGFRLVMNNGESANQNYQNLYVQVLGGQTLSWPPGVPNLDEKMEKLTIEEPIPEAKKDEETDKSKLKNEIFIKELGFSHVVEMMIEA